MHLEFSASISSSTLSGLFHSLATSYQADMLLSGMHSHFQQAGESRCIIGIAPSKELTIEEQTTRADIHTFCFGKNSPKAPSPSDNFDKNKQAVSHWPEDGPTLGFLGYEYGMLLHGLKTTKEQDFPLGLFRKYCLVLIVELPPTPTPDSLDATVSCYRAASLPDELIDLPQQLYTLCKTSQNPAPPFIPPAQEHTTDLPPSLDKGGYLDGVEQVLEQIRSGNTYQLNLSIAFAKLFSNPEELDTAALFIHLWQQFPAPFYAYIHCGAQTILSTSPERFIKVDAGNVLSQPIKGTLAYTSYSHHLAKQLTESPKESAELSMIVDLIRNDISSQCEYGSVKVTHHKSTFTVDNLLQMYSNIHGKLKHSSTCIDLLLDAFPGGSITGCPKLRTMQIINSLEPHARDLYCGSVVYIENTSTMDSNIAIRTGWYNRQTGIFRYFAGSGLVIDSIAENEYEETLAKAHKFRKVFKTSNS